MEVGSEWRLRAHRHEPKSTQMNRRCVVQWPATIRFSGRIASAAMVTGVPHDEGYRTGPVS